MENATTAGHSTRERSKFKHTRRPHKAAKVAWTEKDPADVPLRVRVALKEAMRIEGVSAVHYKDLLWIIAQESGGVINARNPSSTARGLFQLLRAQYSLNPNGEKSFGNPVEECQGGIHYVMGRYHSAAAAKSFWRQHHWY